MAATELDILKRPLYVYDLPKDILDTLELKVEPQSDASAATPELSGQDVIPSAEGKARVGTTSSGDLPAATSCNVCGLSFSSVQEQRNHTKSDLHGFNVKQKLKGRSAVSEAEFEKMMADLDESISGSESDHSGSDSAGETQVNESKARDRSTALAALMNKQASLDTNDDNDFTTEKRKRGPGKPPFIWFNSSRLPSNTSLGVYRALFTPNDLASADIPVQILRKKQLSSASAPKREPDEGGVPLPSTNVGPHIFLCMIGGGHFAAMIVSLAPKVGKKNGFEERQASVVAHKTFHRYTTRRKQGGSQAAHDASGAASSAGASLRRYNEAALTSDVRQLLTEWKDLINTSELLFIRAAGNTNKQTLFGPYDGQVLHRNDSRNRGFPFSTRRATQSELMRCFVELTRLKVSQVDEAALVAAQEKAVAEAEAEAQKKAAAEKAKEAAAKQKEKDQEDEVAILHTTQIEALIKRSKAPALISYISSNSLSPDFGLHPPNSAAHHHAPTPLHTASRMNSPAIVTALLVKSGADPTVLNEEGKTPFQIAGDRATRDAFRLARSELGEAKWDWEKAHVPDPLSISDINQRAERERQEESSKEHSRRTAEMERIKEEEQRKEAEREKRVNDQRDKKMGKGKSLGERTLTAEERREEEARGMTPEMRMKLERERRARAAEERLRRMQQGGT